MLKFAIKKSVKYIFHDAVANKDITRIRFLLESDRRGFKIDELDEDGLTALQRSCFIGNIKLVQLLVTYGANIDVQDREGWTVLHASAVAGNVSILRYLVCMGADVFVRNDSGELAIELAGDLHCVIILAEAMITAGRGDIINAYFSRRPSLKALIEDKVKCNVLERQTIECSKVDNLKAASQIHKKVSVSKQDSVSLYEPEHHEPLGMASIKGAGGPLIEEGGEPEEGSSQRDYKTTSRVACTKCEKKTKRFPTTSSCSVSSDSSGSNSSDSAYVSSGSLRYDSSPSQCLSSVNMYSSTPDDTVFRSELSKQSSTSKNRKVHKCRKHEKHKTRSNSSSPAVTQTKRYRILDQIREHENVNALDESGLCLLHVVASQGDTEGVKMLLGIGAEVNRQALNGSTPLHQAAKSGKIECILLLLNSGADLFAENDNGLLPIDKANSQQVKVLLNRAMTIR